MSEPTLATTTHTVVLSQVAELNDALNAGRHGRVTAGDLGLEQTGDGMVESDRPLPESAVLVRLCCIGSSEWPYIHGHFRVDPPTGQAEELTIQFHSEALRKVSRRMVLRQYWGD